MTRRYFTQQEVMDILDIKYRLLVRHCNDLQIEWEKSEEDSRYKKISERDLLALASHMGKENFTIPPVMAPSQNQDSVVALAQQLEVITTRFENITQSWERERTQMETELTALRQENQQLSLDLAAAKRENAQLKRKLASLEKPEPPLRDIVSTPAEYDRMGRTPPEVSISNASLLSPIVVNTWKEQSAPRSTLEEGRQTPAPNGNDPLSPPPGSVPVEGFFSSHRTSKGLVDGFVHRGEVETWQGRGEYFTIEQHAQLVAKLYERDLKDRKGKPYAPGEKRKEHLCSQCTYHPEPQQ